MRSMHCIVVEMILRWAVNCSHFWPYLTIVKFLFQDGIYPDTAPDGYDGRDFLENVVSQCN